ncbi:lipase [Mythimna separata entomopoxvirus 'L']|uniref:Lipase n=1 Tax=Mythimna separata entomopoxvirus 'L' TaxID=1293572 RepID=A0A916KQ60_9POXV|nr:lipase [Mythimna separata entomopoxvirus 'L']CCU56342.1 lipase [Mythimna separata entomopoxvirus 'L']
MILLEIVIGTIVLLSFICIIFLYIILYIKKRIYDILNEDINIDIELEKINYPLNLYTDKFNPDILKYLIKILLDFNTENKNNNTLIYSDIYDKIYYIYYNKKRIIKIILDKNNNLWLVVRGTLTYNEFEHDLRISQSNLGICGIKCHKGFSEIYSKIQKELFELLNKINPNKILCLGHSLGGGVLTIASHDLFTIFKKCDIIIYTTGTPRICNKIFYDVSKNLNIYKIENLSDVYINAIPPVLPFYDNISYYKIGKILYFDDNRENIIINHKLELYFSNIKNLKYL